MTAAAGAPGDTSLLLLSGPNLQLLGSREPEIYGSATLADHVGVARATAEARGCTLEHLQSNHEGDLVDAIAAARGRHAAIVINPGAFTHYSWAIHDALASFAAPIVELHLSNPQTREAWRHVSVVSPVATALVAGLGGRGYRIAVDAAIDLVVASTGG